MATTIKLKNSVTTTNAPSSLAQGEVAINITDKKVWVGNAATTPIQLLGAGGSASFGALTCTSLTNSGLTSGRVTYASTGGLLADSANFTFNGTTVTMANDASISGLTVGKGGGSVTNNIVIGANSIPSGATGNFNHAFGWNTLTSLSSGIQNNAIGAGTLNANTTGSYNNALGVNTMISNTTGANNTALGHNALYSNTTASNNTAVGYQAGYSNTTGEFTAVGANALDANTTGVQNVGVGRNAAGSNTTGNFNSTLGDNSLPLNTTGSSNTAIGNSALYSNTTASYNTAVGYQAAYSNQTGTNLTAIGYQAGYQNTATDNTFIGWSAGYYNTSGSNNVVLGSKAYANGGTSATGSYNTAIGVQALTSNNTASNNTAVGYQATYTNTTGGQNTSLGYQALRTNNADNNTAVGYQALYTSNSNNNTALGYQAGYAVTSGYYHTFVGLSAGAAATTGNTNAFFGYASGNAVTTGSKNTIIGSYSGNQGGLDIRTSSNYIVLSDGDGNPRVIVDNNANLLVGTTSTTVGAGGSGTIGFRVDSTNGILQVASSGNNPAIFNRTTNDGTIVSLRQDGTEEGTISVSGSTVSYNGGHLSRWSQLPNNQKDNSILKGTVMSNLDDMCVWVKDGQELQNEQLNKMKVSDVEGDTNVAGVFVNWTFDEECQSEDMNVAMTGDMIIRIAEGVVVQKGDLLMSAGDGTAKPQGDDIRRSKTVAKVTSNHVTCTYEDGSYCVPCVLMAC